MQQEVTGQPILCVTVTSNTCWRSPPAWLCCNTSCSKFTLAGDVHLGRAFINMLLPDLHLEWQTTFYLEGRNRIQQTSEKEKPVVGIFGGIFPVTDQLHHLIGLDPGRHLLGQQKCSSKPCNTTALQNRVVNIPFLSKLGCVYRFLYSPAPHGAHFETLLVGKETRNISCMKLQSTNQYVSINKPGFHTLCCLYSAGKQFSIKANWSNALYFLFKQ